jgi:hypothetical protein
MAGMLAGALPTAVLVAAGVAVIGTGGVAGLIAGVVVAVIAGVARLTAGVVEIAVGVVGVVAGEPPTAGLLADSAGLAAGGAVIESAGGIGGIAGGVVGGLLVADGVEIAGGLTPIVGTVGGEIVGRLSEMGGIGKLDLLGATVVGLRLPVLADKAIGLLVVGATATPALGDELRTVLAPATAVFTPVGEPLACAIELSEMFVTLLGAVLMTWVVVLLLAVILPSELVFST